MRYGFVIAASPSTSANGRVGHVLIQEFPILNRPLPGSHTPTHPQAVKLKSTEPMCPSFSHLTMLDFWHIVDAVNPRTSWLWEAQPMRVACSFFLSALLVYPDFGQSSAQPTQESKDQHTAQKPETVSLKQPLAFGLEDGTPIKLRLTRNLSSADATTGDRVDFEVLEDVKVKDVIVIPRGGLALATITEAQHKRRMARGGKLNVNIDDVRLADGEKAPLRAVKEAKGGGHTGAMTGAMIGTAIVFFPAAPLFLFMHGKDITIPKGTEVTAYINGDIPLDPKRFAAQTTGNPETGAAPVQPTAGATAAQNGSGADAALSIVDIKSTPDGAEITVDDKFMGSTPSSLRLAVGDHKIRLGKSGFKSWERTMTVSAGATATVDATLEKQE